MPRSFVLRLIVIGLSASLFAAPVSAGHHHHGGPVQAPPVCQPQTITKTIMVPRVEYRTMTVPDFVCKPVVHQRTVPVTRMIPETTVVTRQVPIVTPEAR